MESWRNQLVYGIHFDVLNADFWPRSWPPRPDSPAESRQIVAERLAEAPALIPIYSHRAIPNEPLEAGNPVYSIWQTDMIVYGNDLADYLWHEFDVPSWTANWSAEGPPERTIRFWSEMLDWNEAWGEPSPAVSGHKKPWRRLCESPRFFRRQGDA